jgi:hypothetical protein
MGGLVVFSSAALGQSNLTVGTPPTVWNSYFAVSQSLGSIPTTTLVFGVATTPTTPTAPAEITTTMSALPPGVTSTYPIGSGGTDIVGNTYQLLRIFGISFVEALAKTSPSGTTTYLPLPSSVTPSRPSGLMRTNTAFYLISPNDKFDDVYRLNPDGSLVLVTRGPDAGPSNSGAQPPSIGLDDSVTYSYWVSGRGFGLGPNDYAATQISAPVRAVPYLQPALPVSTPLQLSPTPTLALSTNVYSSLPISYQWSYNGSSVSGANQASYSGPFLGTGTYALLATTAGGTVSTSTQVQFTVAGVTVGTRPIFLTQPVSANAVLGSPLTLRATAAATSPVSLQWALDGVPIPGANTTIPSAVNYGEYATTFAATQPGIYTVIATTTGPDGGAVASNGATVNVLTSAGVTVLPSPKILTQPSSVSTLYVNGAVTPTSLTVSAAATLPLSYQWFRDGTAIAGATSASTSVTSPGAYTVAVATTAGTVTSQTATVTVVTSAGVTVTAVPTILTQPQGAGVIFGSGTGLPTLGVTAVALQPISYQWSLNGTPIAGATAATYKTTTAGTYTVTVTTGSGAVNSVPAAVSLANRLANISGRFQVGTGANIGIAGFVVTSYTGAAKPILVRGVGPGLSQFGVGGVLAQPVLSVFDSAGRLVASNAGWNGSTDIAAAGQAVGTFPLATGSSDAALVLNLAPGGYTAQIAGAGGTTGVALAEVYEIGGDAGQFVSIAERAVVGAGAGVLIGGFTVAGSQPSKVLIRAVGPGLIPFGLTGALASPVLSVYDSRGVLIGVNTGWSAGGSVDAVAINNAALSVGAFLLQPGTNDCAVLLTLPPGGYTAQVAGANGASGVALVEVYQVPQ